MEAILKAEGVSFAYNARQRKILSDLSFEICRGEILNILGQNAVGKTTLIRCIMRELADYSGNITVSGKNIRNYTIREYSRKLGYVSSDFNAYQNLLTADYLLTGFTNILSGISQPSAELLDKAYNTLSGFNKESLFNKRVDNLSSGEKQIVMLCRVLLQNPEIIIVDEPTANLDVKNQIAVLQQIIKLSKDGYTVIITSHNPGHAAVLGGKTLLMGEGKYCFGATETVLNEDNLSDYYGMKVKIKQNEEVKSIVFNAGNEINIVL